MKSFFLTLFIISLNTTYSIPVGFNQAWFKNNYGIQYIDNYFDPIEVKRIIKLAANAKASTLRLWFFEDPPQHMMEFDKHIPIKLSPLYIDNVIKMLKIADQYKMKIYMTLFDGNMYIYPVYSEKIAKKFLSLFSEQNAPNFLKNILGPLLQKIEDEKLSHVIDKFDLINEIDALIKHLGSETGKKRAEEILCTWKDFIHSYPSFSKTPVSSSVKLDIFTPLTEEVLTNEGPLRCADFIDLHAYNNDGVILGCDLIKDYVKNNNKKVIIGEFGQDSIVSRYDDKLQKRVTKKFIQNAKKCGISAIIAWRLSDIRRGFNSEARYSYEAFGRLRPAYSVIKKHNEKRLKK